MVFLDMLEVFTEDRGEVLGSVAADHLFMTAGGILHPLSLMEIFAQGAAAHDGFRRLRTGVPVGGGFLATARDFVFHRAPRVGDSLRVVAERDLAIGSLQLVRGVVRRGADVLAEGELVFFLSDTLVPAEMPPQADLDRGGIATGSPSEQTIAQALGESRRLFDAGEGRAVYEFGSDFPAFRGHFPGYPILPAVVSVMCAEQTVIDLGEGEFVLRRVVNAKFPQPVLPSATVDVAARPVPDRDHPTWKVQLRVDDAIVAKMTLEGRATIESAN
jgi:3-hydroxyacyl-[acyl-carrier-protein] dehydratase